MSTASKVPSSMEMIEIRQELESLGVETDLFIEKIEFIDALVNARKESSMNTPLNSEENVNQRRRASIIGPNNNTDYLPPSANRRSGLMGLRTSIQTGSKALKASLPPNLSFMQPNFDPRNDQGLRSSANLPPASPSSPQVAVQELLASLQLPRGLLSSVMECYNSCHSTLWLLDNSSGMKVRDSKIVVNLSGSCDGIKFTSRDNVSRWRELLDCISFHSHMASKCWIRSHFWLLNDDNDDDGIKFSICGGCPEDVPNEIICLRSVLKQATLAQDQCLLTEQLSKLEKMISKMPPGQTVTVVICTQGVPKDKKGETSRDIQRDFWNAMKKLLKLPVKIVMHLCTGDDSVFDVYNIMDSRVKNMDVLDDYWGEVRYVRYFELNC